MVAEGPHERDQGGDPLMPMGHQHSSVMHRPPKLLIQIARRCRAWTWKTTFPRNIWCCVVLTEVLLPYHRGSSQYVMAPSPSRPIPIQSRAAPWKDRSHIASMCRLMPTSSQTRRRRNTICSDRTTSKAVSRLGRPSRVLAGRVVTRPQTDSAGRVA